MVNLESKVNGYNCYDQIMSSVLSYYGCASEYPIILTKRWWFDFGFENTDNCLGDRLIIALDDTEIFDYITGIRKYKLNNAAKDEIPLKTKEILEAGKLITARVDGYYSSWDSHYMKIHGGHAVIIVGIDIDKEVLYCSDRYYSNKIESVEFSVLSDWVKSCTTYESISRPRKLTFEENEQIVLSHIESMYEQDIFGKMRKFADYIQEIGRAHV